MKIYRPGFLLTFLFLFLFLFLFASTSGQNFILSGYGSGYKNAELKFYSQTDPVTKRLKPLLNINCDEKGSFSCEIPFYRNKLIFIKTGIYSLHLYITDSSRYVLHLPDYVAKPGSEELNPFYIETELIPDVVNNQLDVNNLIRVFDSEYNPVFNQVADYVLKNYKKEEIQQEISKLDKYLLVNNQPFYNDYVKCRLIMLNLVNSSADQDQARAIEFVNKNFNSENEAFLDLAEQMFSGYLTKLSSGQWKDYFNRAIAMASFTELKSVILRDGKITNMELADYVVLMNLNTDYYERNLPGENVRKIISLMRLQGETIDTKNMASTVLDKINSTLPGNIPPDFSLFNSDNSLMGLKDFRGKYLLLGFVRSDNPTSLMELGIINMWYKKYIKDVQIVTILTDSNFKSGTEACKKRGFGWIFLDGSKRENLEFNYDLKMYPSFILLDREGKMIANPCPFPSESLEFTIEKVLLADPARSGSENR